MEVGKGRKHGQSGRPANFREIAWEFRCYVLMHDEWQISVCKRVENLFVKKLIVIYSTDKCFFNTKFCCTTKIVKYLFFINILNAQKNAIFHYNSD